MTDFDFAVFVLVAAMSVWGGYQGLVRQATTLGAWSVGIVAAVMFHKPVSEWIGGTAPANEIGAAIILLFVTSFVVHLFGGQVRAWIEDAELVGFDRQMGWALGAVKGVAVATLVVIAGYHLHKPSRGEIAKSFSARHVANIVERVEPLVPPPAGAWITEYAKRPFEDVRDHQPSKPPRKLFVASRPTDTRR